MPHWTYVLTCMRWLPQEREEEELLALAAMSDGEDAAEPGEPGGGGASATQSAAEETVGDSTAAAQSAMTDAAGAAVDDADARPSPANLQATPMDDMQVQAGGLSCLLVGSSAVTALHSCSF